MVIDVKTKKVISLSPSQGNWINKDVIPFNLRNQIFVATITYSTYKKLRYWYWVYLSAVNDTLVQQISLEIIIAREIF